MTPQNTRSAPAAAGPAGDPWHAFGYLVAGVGFYGLLGGLADRWLGTSFLVVLGILLGAGFGIYLTFVRFNAQPATPATPATPTQPAQNN